jgi:hypothetical protein
MISISSEPSISPEPSSSYLQENAPLFGVLFPYVSPGQSGQMFGVFSKHKIALTAKKTQVCFRRVTPVEDVLQMTLKNGLFEIFIYKNEHFTKTGSGQT